MFYLQVERHYFVHHFKRSHSLVENKSDPNRKRLWMYSLDCSGLANAVSSQTFAWTRSWRKKKTREKQSGPRSSTSRRGNGASFGDGLLRPKRKETHLNCVATAWIRRGVSGRSYARVICCLKCGRWWRYREGALPSCRLGQDGSNAGGLCMVWIYKSITCPEKPGIILIVTLCEGEWCWKGS